MTCNGVLTSPAKIPPQIGNPPSPKFFYPLALPPPPQSLNFLPCPLPPLLRLETKTCKCEANAQTSHPT